MVWFFFRKEFSRFSVQQLFCAHVLKEHNSCYLWLGIIHDINYDIHPNQIQRELRLIINTIYYVKRMLKRIKKEMYHQSFT